MQMRVAKQRPSLTETEYVAEFAKSGVGACVAVGLHAEFSTLCSKGILPHPDDGLFGFYFDEGECLEDMLETLFDRLSLPQPTRYSPEITPYLESARDLAVYLQQKLNETLSAETN